jgi:hypothetical protein
LRDYSGLGTDNEALALGTSAKAATRDTMDKAEMTAKGGEMDTGSHRNKGDDKKRLLVVSMTFAMREGVRRV